MEGERKYEDCKTLFKYEKIIKDVNCRMYQEFQNITENRSEWNIGAHKFKGYLNVRNENINRRFRLIIFRFSKYFLSII